MLPRFEQFITERRYLMNVSPATLNWYTHALKWMPNENPTQDELNAMVCRMREQGLKATGCNAATRAINAYLKWSSSACHLKPMKEPQFIPETFAAEQIQLLVSFKPKKFYERRLHLLCLLLLDTGARISEALTLHVADVDLDNLLITLMGKGGKQRRVPFSMELRRALFSYIKDCEPRDYLLARQGQDGRKLGRGTALHEVKRLCVRLGFAPPARTLHAFRHTFAVNYLRRGGSTFHLQKMLGHSSLEMTRRYASLLTSDLQEVHQRISLLSRAA